MGKLEGRIAVVTGGHRGIGRGIAEAFAAEGADVAIADRCSKEDAVSVLKTIESHGRRAMFTRTDVAREEDVRAMAEQVLGTWGRVDILVNNAGMFTQALVENLSVEEWDRVLAVNLRGHFLCTRFLLPQMLERGEGRIINMASQLGQIGGVEVAHYAASKAGVIGFTKSLAREVASRGVLVNAIAPGPILTAMMDGETEDWKSSKLGELPIGRFGEVHEVVPTAVLLASSDGAYYVGQTLGPNGGDVML